MIAENGDKVHIHYTGTLDSGETFDSSLGKDPIAFVLGEKMVIPGFEDGVRGMEQGQEKDIVLSPDQAYGPYRDELVQEVPKEALGDIEPKVGMMLAMQMQGMPHQFPGKITKVSEDKVTIDINPPLAGQTLHFHLTLEKIEKVSSKPTK